MKEKSRSEQIRDEIEQLVATETCKLKQRLSDPNEKISLQRFADFMKDVVEGYGKINKLDGTSRHFPPIKIKNINADNFYWPSILLTLAMNQKTGIPSISFSNCSFGLFTFETDGFTEDQIGNDRIGMHMLFTDCFFENISIRKGSCFPQGLFISQSEIGSLQFPDKRLDQNLFIDSSEIGSILANSVNFRAALFITDCIVRPYRKGEARIAYPIPVIDFIGANFTASVSFYNTTFYPVPLFLNCQNLSNINFDHISIKRAVSANVEQLSSIRILKTEVLGKHNDYTAMLLASYEMEARYGLILKNAKFPSSLWIEKKASEFYAGLNTYGRNLVMPWIWWFFFWITLGIVYYGMGGIVYSEAEAYPWVEDLHSKYKLFPLNMLYSFKMMLGPLGVMWETESIQFTGFGFRFLGFLQQLGSSMLIFLWILQVRRRFKIS